MTGFAIDGTDWRFQLFVDQALPSGGISGVAVVSGALSRLGMPLSVGLSATLLFRGLSFWLPMVPGLICSRRLLRNRRD